MLSTFMAGSTTSMTVTRIHFLTRSVVFVDVHQEIQGGKAGPIHVAACLVKNGPAWEFVDVRPYAFMPIK
jgi:hypothetical protein